MDSAVKLCADAVAGWHAAWLTALGLRSTADADAWRALDRPPHIYFSAITLRPDTPAEAVADTAGAVCDSWQTIDLAHLGFRDWRHEPWFLCASSERSDAETPAELEIVRVATAAEVGELEAVSVRGFENEDATIEPGTLHPPAILDDPRMVLWLGRVAGKPVGAAMSYRTDEAVGIFGVTTIASARRRGYGTALTRAAMLVDSGLPSVLAPSPEGEKLYRRLGFEHVGELRIWSRRR
jgi:ribosomal protein S18 acetylase RimI-like enzyme